jgi:type I restriction enzyme S subunit
VEPVAPDTSELPELPEGWCWVRTEQCIMTQVGHAFSSKEFIDEGVNLLRGDNIGHGALQWGDNRRRCIRPEALNIHAHLELKPGDVVTMTVEGIGTISNKVVASTAVIHEIPPARKRQRGVRH